MSFLLLALAAAACHAGDHSSDRPLTGSKHVLPDGVHELHVPIVVEGNEVRLDATVNGAGPFHLVLDTGMPMGGILLFHSDAVDALHLGGASGEVRVAGAGDPTSAVDTSVARDVPIAIGKLSIPDASVVVMPRPAGFPPRMQGIVGGELFYQHVVRVDFDRGEIVLSDPDAFAPPKDAAILPLVREQGLVFVDVGVKTADAEPAVARCVVDLGAGHAISLNTRDDGRFAPAANAIETRIGRGVSGPILGKTGRLTRLELGPFAFEHVLANYPIAQHQKPGGADHKDGNLGAEILRRFVATFDYANERLVLERGKSFGEPFERDMLGAALEWNDDGTTTVAAVVERSPAAEAGLRVDDEVLSLDGRTPNELGETALRKALEIDGAKVRLVLRRGGEKIEKQIVLRRLV